MSKQILNEEFKHMQKLAGLITESVDFNNNSEMFDRMNGLANIQDMNVFNAKLRLLVSDWMNQGFEKEDIKEYINFLIDEI